MNWPEIYTQDYVNALILNDVGEAMIIEGHNHDGGWSSWQVVGSYLKDDEDPYTAIQRELLAETGYSSKNWLYLGSYTTNTKQNTGIGHFFYATSAQRITEPKHNTAKGFSVKWVSIADLKCALIDGRIAAINYAANIAIALLMLDKPLH